MNRNEALAWCVRELKEWPRIVELSPEAPDGWDWHTTLGGECSLLSGVSRDASIREEDWNTAKATCIAGNVIADALADALAVHAPPHDAVNSPKHYQLLPGVEVYDIRQALAAKATEAGATLDQFSDYDRAIEYLLRMWEKNGKQDAEKAAWYLNKLIGKLS